MSSRTPEDGGQESGPEILPVQEEAKLHAETEGAHLCIIIIKVMQTVKIKKYLFLREGSPARHQQARLAPSGCSPQWGVRSVRLGAWAGRSVQPGPAGVGQRRATR